MVAKRHVDIDLNIDEWHVAEVLAFREATKCNPEAAGSRIQAAFSEASSEARQKWGEKVDEEGWEPPDDWRPESLLDIDPVLLLGFSWITERRREKVTFEDFSESLSYGQLLEGFYAAMSAAVEAADPLENRAQRRRSVPRSKTASKSRAPSAGRSPKSAS